MHLWQSLEKPVSTTSLSSLYPLACLALPNSIKNSVVAGSGLGFSIKQCYAPRLSSFYGGRNRCQERNRKELLKKKLWNRPIRQPVLTGLKATLMLGGRDSTQGDISHVLHWLLFMAGQRKRVPNSCLAFSMWCVCWYSCCWLFENTYFTRPHGCCSYSRSRVLMVTAAKKVTSR